MSDLEKILKLVEKNDGYITTKEVVDNKLNKMALKRLCDNGLLERISTGYYSLPNMINDDYYKIISKSKNAVFSYTTALFLHDLSDRTPLYFDITVPRGYGGPLQNIDIVDCSDQFFEESKTTYNNLKNSKIYKNISNH